jgi:ergothioneine biosynthesis protein EgtB
LIARFQSVRRCTEALAAPLSPEDQMLQSMPDCSPTRWHRAHTTWFFETFILQPRGVAPYNPRWGYLFNSYYEAVGPRYARPRRGMISRPSVAEVGDYRRVIDEHMSALLERATDEDLGALGALIELGLAHEEQHQELILTDILHALHENPLRPAYRAPASAPARGEVSPLDFIAFEGGLVEVGARDDRGGFVFDNEAPRHRVWLDPFALSTRLVTVGEVKAFIREGGYRTPSLWLSEGREWARANDIKAPSYARVEGEDYVVFGLEGERVASDDEPAAHLSFYEADALAQFLGARLPTEFEWEHAARNTPIAGHFLDDTLRPLAARGDGLRQLWGDAWEWTRSSYEPYPGYAPSAGAIGEYNGKFMVNQRVLRGGSYLTPPGHVRLTYRNFWHPHIRFQATGVRLARGA